MALGTTIVGSKTIGLMIPTPLRTIASLQTDIFLAFDGNNYGLMAIDTGLGESWSTPLGVRDGSAYRECYSMNLDQSGSNVLMTLGTNQGNVTIAKVSDAGVIDFEVAIGITPFAPRGICEDQNGDIWVPQSPAEGISRYSSAGVHQQDYVTLLDSGVTNEIVSDGSYVYTATNGGWTESLHKYSLTGVLQYSAVDQYSAAPIHCKSIKVLSDGNVVGSGYGTISGIRRGLLFKRNALDMSEVWTTMFNDMVEDFQEDSLGDIYVYDADHYVYKVNGTGVIQWTAGPYLFRGGPSNLSLGRDDFIYIQQNDNTMHKISKVDGTNEVLDISPLATKKLITFSGV